MAVVTVRARTTATIPKKKTMKRETEAATGTGSARRTLESTIEVDTIKIIIIFNDYRNIMDFQLYQIFMPFSPFLFIFINFSFFLLYFGEILQGSKYTFCQV